MKNVKKVVISNFALQRMQLNKERPLRRFHEKMKQFFAVFFGLWFDMLPHLLGTGYSFIEWMAFFNISWSWSFDPPRRRHWFSGIGLSQITG
jgi:hypothetical protein